MPITGNHLDNNALAALSKQAGPRITNAIKLASHRTGVDFSYLMEKAAAESSFDAAAKSGSSSATGLYQFIESTWMDMVKKHGHKYGMGDYAAHINDRGKVEDPALRQEILGLRKDPGKAALLAAEYAAENKRYLANHTDLAAEDIRPVELYLAHFMGAGGAATFLNAQKDNPLATAADIFPKAAAANRNVFYDSKTGEARTLAGVYEFFEAKFKTSEKTVASADKTAETLPATGGPKTARPAFPSPATLPSISPARHDPVIWDFIAHPLLRLLRDDDAPQQPFMQNAFLANPAYLALLANH